MPVNIPVYRLELGLEGKLWCNGVEVGHAPTAATGTLLSMLAEACPNHIDRKTLARRLYPDSTESAAMNALRQTILRLRRWLGPESIRTHDRTIGLEPSMWHVEIDKSRKTIAKPDVTGVGVRDSYTELVCRLAELDVDAARSLFLGGKKLADCLPLPTLADMLKLTRPNTIRDQGAIDHLLYYGRYYHQTVQFTRAETAHMRVYRLAEQARRHTVSSAASAWLLFTYVEMGDLNTARQWLPTVTGNDRTVAGRLFAANAKACFLWNDMDFEGARDQFERASKLLHHSSRSDQAHYWSNYAVFSAEAGDLAHSEDCVARAKEYGLPGIDVISEHNVMLATALGLRQQGEAEQSLALLESVRQMELARGHTLGVVYEMETAAESYATLGHKATAIRIWNEAEATRHAGGGRLTPRLAAMKNRIKVLAG